MTGFTDRPLVCVALALAGGIALAAAVGGAAVWVTGAAAIGTGAVWAVGRRPAAGALALLGAAAAAGGALLGASGQTGVQDVSRLEPGGHTIVGTVAGAPSHRDGVWRFVLAAEAQESAAGATPVTGRVYVRLRSAAVERGERWRLTGRLRPVRAATNPGQRSEAGRLGSLGVSSVLTVGAPELAEKVGPGKLPPVSRHAFAAQRAALAALERHVGGPYRETTGSVAASVIFGVHSAPPSPEIVEAFRRAGTIHLLVVSGTMVSMVFAMVFLPGALGAGWRRGRTERQSGWPLTSRGRIAFRPGLWAAVAGVGVVTYYAALTEGGQAVVRATVMGALAGGALALRRVPGVAREHGLNVDRYTLLGAAAVTILAVSPGALFLPGFQLSFAAVWAIVYLAPKAAWLVAQLPRWLGYTIVGTISAQLATAPLLVYHTGQAPVAGFGANIPAIPLAGVVLAGGMATCVLSAVVPFLAPVAGWMTGVATRWLVAVSAAFAALPWASLDTRPIGAGAVAACYAGLAALGYGLERLRVRLS